MMTPRLRKLALTMHVAASVGWLGAVATFLALSITGLNSTDAQSIRTAYLAMPLVTWGVIVPLSVASLITGLVQSLGTPWGLFRHYWVIAKLSIAVVATILLLLHTNPIDAVAAVAAERALSSADLRQVRVQLLADAAAALLALVVATTLSVYKPQGVTHYGRRKQLESIGEDEPPPPNATRLWRNLALGIGILLFVLFVLRHVTHGGMMGH